MTDTTNVPDVTSDPGSVRYGLLQLNQTALKHLAWKATVELGYQPSDIVVVSVQVDSVWRFVAERLMPDGEEAWEASRARGEEPNVIGTMEAILCEELSERFPSLENVLNAETEAGMVLALILADDGCLAVEVKPELDVQNVQ